MKQNVVFICNRIAALSLATLYFAWWVNAGSPLGAFSLTALSIGVIPMVLLAIPLGKGNRTATVFAGFITPFYLAHALMEWYANADVRAWVAMASFLTAYLFIASMLTLRQVSQTRQSG